MTTTPTDAIDALAGIAPDSAVDGLRRRRPVTRQQVQAGSDALFDPVEDGGFTVAERLLIAAFATQLTASDPTARHYADLARRADPERAEVVRAEALGAAAPGPFGVYTEAGLAAENRLGPRYAPDGSAVRELGVRLAAGLAHAQLLVSRPREADAAALDRLLAAGWTTDQVVTLSHLVSFLAFQQRIAAGLRVLAADLDAASDHDEEATA